MARLLTDEKYIHKSIHKYAHAHTHKHSHWQKNMGGFKRNETAALSVIFVWVLVCVWVGLQPDSDIDQSIWFGVSLGLFFVLNYWKLADGSDGMWIFKIPFAAQTDFG